MENLKKWYENHLGIEYEDAPEQLTEEEAYGEAYAHLDCNVIGAYVGEHTPIIMYKEIYD